MSVTHGPERERADVLFRLLGPVEATAGGRPCRLGPPKHRAVLALLLLTPGQVVPTARFVAELWGEEPPKSAVPTLQAYLSRLRAALTVSPEEGIVSGVRLTRRSPGYLLEIPYGSVDVQRFEALSTAGRASLEDDDPRAARSSVDDAMALVAGPPLADVADLLGPAAAEAVRRFDEMALAAQEVRIDAMLCLGDATAATSEAGMLAHRYPLRERLHALHMLALYRGGRQAEALAAYDRARRHLARELGVEPGSALSRMHARVLAQDPELDGNPGPHTCALGRASGFVTHSYARRCTET